jgi:TRAP-type C4-dicarboxylate transport system permease small subunit
LYAVGGCARTPLVLLYFGLIASAPLRLSLRLVYTATAAAMLGYLFLLGYYAWHLVGFHKYYATPELRIPRSEEAIYLLAMLVCGLFAGQVVRQVRRMIVSPVRVESDAPEGQ